jgi:hypothetical protein
MRWVEHVARMAGKRETRKLLVIRPEPERLIEKLSERCENDIKNYFQTMDWRDRAELTLILLM